MLIVRGHPELFAVRGPPGAASCSGGPKHLVSFQLVIPLLSLSSFDLFLITSAGYGAARRSQATYLVGIQFPPPLNDTTIKVEVEFQPRLSRNMSNESKINNNGLFLCAAECPSFLRAVRSLLPSPFLRGDSALTVSLLSAVLPFAV